MSHGFLRALAGFVHREKIVNMIVVVQVIEVTAPSSLVKQKWPVKYTAE